MRQSILIAFPFAVLFAVGCAGPARYVTKQGAEGVVSVPDDSNRWPHYYRNQAVDLIQKHVGGDYEIVKEEQVVTGQVTKNDQHIDREEQPHIIPWMAKETQRVQNTATTTDVTEWRITYRKRTGPSVGASTVVPAGGVPLPPPQMP